MNIIIKKIGGYVNISSENNDTWMQRDKTLKVLMATGKGTFSKYNQQRPLKYLLCNVRENQKVKNIQPWEAVREEMASRDV